jgi:hypothetical protein
MDIVAKKSLMDKTSKIQQIILKLEKLDLKNLKNWWVSEINDSITAALKFLTIHLTTLKLSINRNSWFESLRKRNLNIFLKNKIIKEPK